MTWPLYFARSLMTGSPASSVGLCLLWTPQERVLPALSSGRYAVAGNLYSREGISFLVRNVLARPTIRTIALCGRDMTGSGAALAALMDQGIDAEHRIIGDGTPIHRELPREAIDLFRRSVRLVDARDRIRPEAIAALLAELPHIAEPFAAEPLVFPYREPVADALPAETSGFVLRGRTVRAAWLRLLWQVMTFGLRSGTQHSSDQRELLDVMTVVEEEPIDPASFSHADWMPFSRESLGQRQPDGSYSGYLGQFLQPGRGDAGVSYTYGDRLRAFAAAGGPLDQVATLVDDLRASGHSRRAVAALWDPAQDAGTPGPPCLNLVQARLRAEQPGTAPRLSLTAYFRSHDIYRAWAANAFGLRALQGLLVEHLNAHPAGQSVGPVEPGDLVIISHSAHIYAHDWEAARDLLAHHRRPLDSRFTRDPRGSFFISLDPPDIVVQHFSPGGEHLQTLRATSAAALGPQLAPYISDMGHALYLGQELHKADMALRLGCPAAYRQDRELVLNEQEHGGEE